MMVDMEAVKREARMNLERVVADEEAFSNHFVAYNDGKVVMYAFPPGDSDHDHMDRLMQIMCRGVPCDAVVPPWLGGPYVISVVEHRLGVKGFG